MRLARNTLLAALVLLLAACATGSSAVHKTVSATPDKPMPRKVLLLPVEINVHEISAGGVVEKVNAWSETASSHANAFLRDLARGKGAFDLIEGPALEPAQKARLDQYIALYEVVAGSAFIAQHSPFEVWQQRAREFDYTLGPGLGPLADATGTDAAMVVIGSDYISSAGRRAAMVMGMILGAVSGVVVVPQGGISFVSVGVVDLHTGDLLWFGTEQGQATDLRNEADVRRMLEGLFRTYPGLTPAAKPAAG